MKKLTEPEITVTLNSWIELHRQVGMLSGALNGLRYRVDDEIKACIDNVLQAANLGNTLPQLHRPDEPGK